MRKRETKSEIAIDFERKIMLFFFVETFRGLIKR